MKFLSFFALALGFAQAQVTPNVEPVDYADAYDNDFPLLGYVSIPESETPVPAVVIIPDWNNVDEYEKIRATMIAEEFGWVGFAADIYGPDYVDSIDGRRANATYYRSNNQLFYGRIQAAVDQMKEHPAVMSDKIAVIGYCFGGTGILTYSFLGATDVVGAVSFHGGLTEFPVTGELNHPVLVLSGGDDDTGTQVENLENTLNEANATWQITRYSGIEHAFTVFDDDRYNARVDARSWREMVTFLGNAFGLLSYDSSPPNATMVETVDYEDDGFSLTGYLAIPEDAEMGSTPAIIIVPDWDGVSGPDGYEAQRATLLAEEGYVAFAADIYGSELQQVESFEERGKLAGMYRTNYTLFVSRIQAAVDLVATHELVNADEVMILGYCFGGTGVVNYAFAGLTNVKAVVPFHGGLTSLAPVETDDVYPYVLIQSGGVDDAHGNNTELEMALNGASATWEITRYSGVDHGFTHWGQGAYSSVADWRSWDAMLTLFTMILDGEVALTGVDDGEDSMEPGVETDGEGTTSVNGDGDAEDTADDVEDTTPNEDDGEDTSINGDDGPEAATTSGALAFGAAKLVASFVGLAAFFLF